MACLGPGTTLAAGDAVRRWAGKTPPSKPDGWVGKKDSEAMLIAAVVGKSMLMNLENEVHSDELGHQGCPSRGDGV